MITELPSRSDHILAFRLSGKLHDDDYKTFVPRVNEAVAQQGNIRMLAEFHDFDGWDARALWDDIKFATEHCASMERIALVGDEKWEKWMAAVCKPFTLAKVKYFDASEIDDAWRWVAEK
jgi:hypothetical protein